MWGVLDLFPEMLVCLSRPLACAHICPRVPGSHDYNGTYKGEAAVRAIVNMRLVKVDVDPRVTQWAPAAVARNNPIVPPPHRLLVDKLDSGPRAGLRN